MARADPDPGPLFPADPTTPRFSLTRPGYDPEEVDGLLRRVAAEISRLRAEVEWHRARMERVRRESRPRDEALDPRRAAAAAGHPSVPAARRGLLTDGGDVPAQPKTTA